MQDPIVISSEGKMNTKKYHLSLRLTKKMLVKNLLANDQQSIEEQMEAFKSWDDKGKDSLERVLDRALNRKE